MTSSNRNGKLTVSDLVINSGDVSDFEVPLFVGTTKVKDGKGNDMLTAVSFERDWLWVRTVTVPHKAHKQWLVNKGFMYSGKRVGWHIPVSVQTCTLIANNLSIALDIPWICKTSAEMVDDWKIRQEERQERKRQAEYKRMANRTTVDHVATAQVQQARHEYHSSSLESATQQVIIPVVEWQGEVYKNVHRNKVGRWVDHQGKWVAAAAVPEKYRSSKAKPSQLPSTVEPQQESGTLSIGETLADIAPAPAVAPAAIESSASIDKMALLKQALDQQAALIAAIQSIV